MECKICGAKIEENNEFEVENFGVVCEDCYGMHTSDCECCGKNFLKENNQVQYYEEYNSYYCNECYKKIKNV